MNLEGFMNCGEVVDKGFLEFALGILPDDTFSGISTKFFAKKTGGASITVYPFEDNKWSGVKIPDGSTNSYTEFKASNNNFQDRTCFTFNKIDYEVYYHFHR
jgi:hypothetical protein